MLKAQVTIEGDRFLADLSRAVDQMRAELIQRLEQETEFRKAELRQYISKYVYEAYKPVQYRRRKDIPLIRVVEGLVRDGKTFVEFVLYNDSAQFQTHRATGMAAGGTQKWEVPWEIEEGRYPQEMNPRIARRITRYTKTKGGAGWAQPRPAYSLYTKKLDREIVQWTGEVFDVVFTRLA